MRIIRSRTVGIALGLGLLAGTGLELPTARIDRAAAAPLRIVVNTSARRLHVYEDGKKTRTYRVAVGQPGHRTPQGSYSISRAVWNPWWIPPDSKWARGKKDTPPGPNNPMGKVKLYFREMYYIHGTPNTGSLGQAVSHGCIRMANSDAIALARLVHSYGSPGVSKSTIDKLVNSRTTRTIGLQRRVPLQIVSSTAEVYEGRLEIFASDEKASTTRIREDAIQALREAGFDLATLDTERLDDLIRAGQQAPVAAGLDELRAAGAPPVAATEDS